MTEVPLTVRAHMARHRIAASDLAHVLRRPDYRLVMGSERGALVAHTKGTFMLLSADDEAYAAELARHITPQTVVLEVCQPHALSPVLAVGSYRTMTVRRFAYLETTPLEYTPRLRMVLAGDDHVATIARCLGYYDEDDVRALVADHNLWCAYEGAVWVGFIGHHEEGTMGMLHIFDGSRRRGFGLELERFLVNHTLAQGELPRGDVRVDNAASLSLQARLGFVEAPEPLVWLFAQDSTVIDSYRAAGAFDQGAAAVQ